MYKRAYGIIETLAPLHVGATAGEESGNLNLIFRDQFTQTGIIPGSSIRGRFRSEMRSLRQAHLEKALTEKKVEVPNSSLREIVEVLADGKEKKTPWLNWLEKKAQEAKIATPRNIDESFWYGTSADSELSDSTTEAVIKFEYASIVWLPVFCPGQPVVWVSSPKLLKRYQRVAGHSIPSIKNLTSSEIDNLKYTGSSTTSKLKLLTVGEKQKLFFNFGLLELEKTQDLTAWFPSGEELPAVVVADDEIGMIHDMALYRQSRVRLKDDEKLVKDGGFFNTEALPEGTIMVFPIAIRETDSEWKPFDNNDQSGELYLGGLESIGFGNCQITLKNLHADKTTQSEVAA
ncbi:MAG: RAMP superfamily CRISPR-associated protein [Leptolyngbyaceae bacterium]|nr:RAMP superfamily CRISPR-associated protein [Leptolyngbyaceae bacterium]